MQLSDVRTLARQKSDEEATGYVSNSEVLSYINQGLRFVYGKIAQRFENYFITKGTVGNGGLITTVSGTDEYNLPTDLMKLVRVEQRQSGSSSENDWITLKALNIGNDNIRVFYPPREGYGPGSAYGYFIAGNKIYLRPVPTQAFSLRIWYVPRVTALSADSDIPGIPEEYHELLAEYAAIQIISKSGEGLYAERSKSFDLELGNLLETIEVRNQQSEQMVITDDYSFDGIGFGPV